MFAKCNKRVLLSLSCGVSNQTTVSILVYYLCTWHNGRMYNLVLNVLLNLDLFRLSGSSEQFIGHPRQV